MTAISKSQQTRSNGKGKTKKPKKKKHNEAWYILQKAWKIQSLGIRKEGYCVGCGSTKDLSAGHLRHGGNGSAWNQIDFNAITVVMALCHNIFCQCSKCNCFDEDGNGMLKTYFDKYYTNDQYEMLKKIKIQEWRPTVEEAQIVLDRTIKIYGKAD
jgi:hypothetical protein